jgi:hypothetical protein
MRFRNIGTGLTLFALIAATSTTHGESLKGTRWRVNCNGGGPSLKTTLTHVGPGDTVFVNGTCRERVSITVGPLTIDGGGNAILDGAGVPPDDAEFNGMLTVDGARGVTIRSMTIRNGARQGILGLHGANMIVEKTIVEGFDPGPAIGLSNSAAELTDVTLRSNGLGIDAYSSSTVILQGAIDISHNLRGGLSLNMNTTAEIRGANVHVDNNGGVGILVVGDSRLAFSGFDVSRGSSLSTSSNKGPACCSTTVCWRHRGRACLQATGSSHPRETEGRDFCWRQTDRLKVRSAGSLSRPILSGYSLARDPRQSLSEGSM